MKKKLAELLLEKVSAWIENHQVELVYNTISHSMLDSHHNWGPFNDPAHSNKLAPLRIGPYKAPIVHPPVTFKVVDLSNTS